MTIDEVKTFLSEHAKDEGVITLMKGSAQVLTSEIVAPFLDTQDGQRLIQPYVDRTVDKAIKTYKDNHYTQDVKASVATELLKLNPQETAEQRRLREVEEKLSKSEKDRDIDRLKRQLVEEASKIGIDAFFIDDYIPASLDEGKLFLSKIKGYVEDQKKKVATELVTKKGFMPAPNANTVDPSAMSAKDRLSFELAETEKRLSNKEG